MGKKGKNKKKNINTKTKKEKDKSKGGRPRMYDSVEEMQDSIDRYFVHCEEKGENIKITGLALWLGFKSRQALVDYEGYSEEFHYTIKRAKLRVESAYEDRLIKRGNGGDIFALKNFKWTDSTEVKHQGERIMVLSDVIAQKNGIDQTT